MPKVAIKKSTSLPNVNKWVGRIIETRWVLKTDGKALLPKSQQ